MGHMAYLANKKNTQIATDAALKEMGHETDSEGNPLGKDPLSKVENFLVGMYESICGSFSRLKGLGESVGNLVGGKGFNTDAELTEQSKQLVDEYNRIKDMTLLAGVGDANMKSATEAAARKAEIENELAKKDPDALAKLQAESPEGKAKAAGLQAAVNAAMAEFDKMNANGEMTSNFIEIKDGGKTIIKKNEMGTPSAEYSFDEKGNTVGVTLYPDIEGLQKNPYSLKGFDYSKTEMFKGMDAKLYSNALNTALQDVLGSNEIVNRPSRMEEIIKNAIGAGANSFDGSFKSFRNEAMFSAMIDIAMGTKSGKALQSNINELPGFASELMNNATIEDKILYTALMSFVGVSVGYGYMEARTDVKDSAKIPIEAGDNNITIEKTKEGGYSTQGNLNVGKVSVKYNIDKDNIDSSVGYRDDDFTASATYKQSKTSDGGKNINAGVQTSVVVNNNLTVTGEANYKKMTTGLNGLEWLLRTNHKMDGWEFMLEVSQRLNEANKKRETNFRGGASHRFEIGR